MQSLSGPSTTLPCSGQSQPHCAESAPPLLDAPQNSVVEVMEDEEDWDEPSPQTTHGPVQWYRWDTDATAAGLRLDAFLAQQMHTVDASVSRTRLQRWIKDGHVRWTPTPQDVQEYRHDSAVELVAPCRHTSHSKDARQQDAQPDTCTKTAHGREADGANAPLPESFAPSDSGSLNGESLWQNATPVLVPKHMVLTGQTWILMAPQPQPICDWTPHPMNLDFYYEDDAIIVLEKPAGVVVHPGVGTHEPTLVHGLLAQCDHLAPLAGAHKPGIVHRLDKDTSGLMVVAKTDAAYLALTRQFADRAVVKQYWAFVWGAPNPPFGRIETGIGRDPSHRLKQAVIPLRTYASATTPEPFSGRSDPQRASPSPARQGRYALTTYRTLASNGHISLLDCGLYTGRTHQIRVHCTHIGHPLVGDSLYRGRRPLVHEWDQRIGRQALHACSLAFDHPLTGEPLSFSSPLPPDLADLYAHVHAPAPSLWS